MQQTEQRAQLIWRHKTGDVVSSSPAVADGVVFAGSEDGSLFALDAENGERRWSYDTGDKVYSSPRVVNGVVYAGSWNGNVYAIRRINW